MKFQILPLNDNIAKMYLLHSTYHMGDSGLDLFTPQDIVILPGNTEFIDLKIKCQLRKWCWYKFRWVYFSYFIFPRSSISKTPLTLKKGERYAQLVRPDLEQVTFEVVHLLRSTDRGSGGFGSTGK